MEVKPQALLPGAEDKIKQTLVLSPPLKIKAQVCRTDLTTYSAYVLGVTIFRMLLCTFRMCPSRQVCSTYNRRKMEAAVLFESNDHYCTIM